MARAAVPVAHLERSRRAAPGNGARHPKTGGFLVRRAPWQAAGAIPTVDSTQLRREHRDRLINIDNGGTLTDVCVVDGDGVRRGSAGTATVRRSHAGC